VAWSSKLQSVVATSTAESEYIAGAAAARTAVWLRRIYADLTGLEQAPVELQGDNRAMLHMAVNSADSARTKHIAVPFHYLRGAVARGQIKVVYVPTHDNVADFFTKALARERFHQFCTALGMA